MSRDVHFIESKLDNSKILLEFTVEIPTALESHVPDEDVSPSSSPSLPTPTQIQTQTPPPTQTSPSTPINSPPSTHQLPPLSTWIQAIVRHSHLSDVELEYTVGSPTNT